MVAVTLILCLASCRQEAVDYANVARESEPLRIRSLNFYTSNGYFAQTLALLGPIGTNSNIGTLSWNGWVYVSDQASYLIYKYPDHTRRSLWFEMHPDRRSATGWFIRDEGPPQPQPIPLLPEEAVLFQPKTGANESTSRVTGVTSTHYAK